MSCKKVMVWGGVCGGGWPINECGGGWPINEITRKLNRLALHTKSSSRAEMYHEFEWQ